MKIDGFNILPVSSISMAATTFVGQNYGAGRLDRVKRSVWVTLAIGVIYTLCTGAALLAGQDAILHLFTADEAVVTYGKLAMRWFCPFYFLLSILHGLAGAVRGTGASIPPMVVLLVSLCLFRVVWIQFLLPFFSGIEGVFILYPVSWGLGALLMILYAWKASGWSIIHNIFTSNDPPRRKRRGGSLLFQELLSGQLTMQSPRSPCRSSFPSAQTALDEVDSHIRPLGDLGIVIHIALVPVPRPTPWGASGAR